MEINTKLDSDQIVTTHAAEPLLGVQQMTVTRKTKIHETVYTVSSKDQGPLFTIKQNNSGRGFKLEDVEGKTVGAIQMRKRCLRPMVLEVVLFHESPMRIRHKSCGSRDLLIIDEHGDQVLKLQRAGWVARKYKIVAENNSHVGELKWSTFKWKYTITCPKDLDVRHKMALFAVSMFNSAQQR